MTKNAKLELINGYYRWQGLELTITETDILQRLARRVQNLAVRSCNEPIEEGFFKRRMKSALEQAKSVIRNQSEWKVEYQGDPRGIVLQVKHTKKNRTLYPDYFN